MARMKVLGEDDSVFLEHMAGKDWSDPHPKGQERGVAHHHHTTNSQNRSGHDGGLVIKYSYGHVAR